MEYIGTEASDSKNKKLGDSSNNTIHEKKKLHFNDEIHTKINKPVKSTNILFNDVIDINRITKGLFSTKVLFIPNLKLTSNLLVKKHLSRNQLNSDNDIIFQQKTTEDNINKKSALSLIYKDIKASKNRIDTEVRTSRNLLNKTRNFNTFKTQSNISSNSKDINLMKATFAGTTINDSKKIKTTSCNKINHKIKPIISLKGYKKKSFSSKKFISAFKEESSYKSSSDSIEDEKIVIVPPKYSRKKTFKVDYIRNWHRKNGLGKLKLSKTVLKWQEMQRNLIQGEILIILDSVQNYKESFFSKKDLRERFTSQTREEQKNYNKLFEETIGLMIEASYLILQDLGDKIERYITYPLSRVTKKEYKEVTNEEQEFIINAKLFSKSAIFLKSCFNSYEIICDKEETFILPEYVLDKVYQFLHRIRLNLSKLIITTRNIYYVYRTNLKISENYRKEILISKYRKKLINDYHHRNFSEFEGGIDYTKYKAVNKVPLSEEQEKKNRINKIFEEFKWKKSRPIIKRSLNLNSKLIDHLLKYSTDEFRRKVNCERIFQRFKEKDVNGITLIQEE